MVEAVTSRLSLPDKITPNKRMFEAVLSEFDVTFTWSKSSIHTLQLEVWINNKRMSHTCTITTESQASNSRAELRRKLNQVNAPRKLIVPPVLPTPLTRADFLGAPLSVAVPATRSDHQHTNQPSKSNTGDPKNVPDSVEAALEAAIEQPSAAASGPIFPPRAVDPLPPAPADVPPPIAPVAIVPVLDSRYLQETTLLNAAEVIVIDLPQGLMVAENHVLIIPLIDPAKYTDMPKAYYQAIFRPVQKKPAPVVVPDIPITAARRTAAQPPPIVEKTAADARPPVAPKPPEPVVTTAAPPPPPPPQPAASAPKRSAPPPVSLEIRSVEGVSAQIARQMAAIYYAQRSQNKPYVPVRVVFELLNERDYKQVSARMPHAAKLGFAERHDIPGKPLQFSITEAGQLLLARLRTWPWEREQMPLPKWANS